MRKQTLFHIVSEEVTQRASEILVTWVGEEAARIGEHTHETAEQSEHRQ